MPEPEIMVGRARAMRRAPTDAERALWRVLRDRRLDGLKFRRQVPLGPYIADFACFEPRIVVECDGGQHVDNAYDQRRDAWMASRGFRLVRVWNADVLEAPDGVAERILDVLGRR